jgi:hypothetical protein
MNVKFTITTVVLFLLALNLGFAKDWVKTVTSTGANNSGTTGSCIVALPNGDVVIGGHYKADEIILDEINFKSISPANKLVSLDKRKSYIAKISNGEFVWAKTFGSRTEDDNLIVKMKADAEGNVFILGSASNPISLGSLSINKTATKGYAYLAKINPDGEFIWAKALDHFNSFDDISFDVNNSGEIIVATTVNQGDRRITQDKIVYNRPGSYTSAILKRFNSAGECIWIRGGVSEGAGSASTSRSVLIDSEGNSYLTGEFMGGKLTFNEASIPLPKGLSTRPACGGVFVAKYDSEGVCKFVSNSGTNFASTNQKPRAFSLMLSDDEQSIYVIGRFSKEFIIWAPDGETKLNEVKNEAQSSYFISKFNSEGGAYQSMFSGEARNCWVEVVGLKKMNENYVMIGNFAGNLEPVQGKRFVSTQNRSVSRQNYFPFIMKLDSNFDFVDCQIPEANAETKINDFCIYGNSIIALGTFNESVNTAKLGELSLELPRGFFKTFIWSFGLDK